MSVPPNLPPNPAHAAQSSGGGQKACLVVGCIGAALAAIVVAIIAAVVVYGAIQNEKKKKTGGSTMTMTYDPQQLPSLDLGSSGNVGEADWPSQVQALELVATNPDLSPPFGSPFAGATYRDEAGQRTVAVHLFHSKDAAAYSQLANDLQGNIAGEGHVSTTHSNSYSQFSSSAHPTTRYWLRAMRAHAAAFIVEYGSAEAAESDEDAEHLVETLYDMLSRPAPVEIGFPSHDESKGDTPDPRGPKISDEGVAWHEPSPTDDHFALARAGVPVPDLLAGMTGEAAAYSALEFEKDVSLPFTLVFLPNAEGDDSEATFQKTIQTLSPDGATIVAAGYNSFSLLDGEQTTAMLFMNVIELDEAFCTVTVFTNGVGVAIFDLPRKPEEVAAFPSLRELAVSFHELLSVAWQDAVE
ncbi:MAG TPA: hypothetical protein PLA50_07055 [Bacteroidia bacterium]|nr:hypothetical protein [Bacteroidia bacterium]